jgi:hypothetical protein
MPKGSLHFQRVPSWAPAVLKDWGASWVKIVNPPASADPLPGLKKVLRFWTDSWDRPLLARGAAGADEYMATAMPAWERRREWGDVAFELPNEPPCNGNDEIAHLVDFTRRCVEIAHAHGFKVVVFNLSEGNPHDNGSGDPSVTAWKMRQLAHALPGADYLGLHGYYCPPTFGPADAAHLLRYRQLLGYIRQEGITAPPVLLTEAGIDGGLVGQKEKGWQIFRSREQYITDMAVLEREVQKDPELLAYFLFTAGYEDPWAGFDHDEQTAHGLALQLRGQDVPRRGPMQIDGRRMAVEEFRQHVAGLKIGPVNAVVIHHTAIPDEKSWRGTATMLAMKSYYEGLGWDSGPHLFVAADGIWLFTPLTQDGTGVVNHNAMTRHIEIVGNYTDHLPAGTTLTNAVSAAAIILAKCGLAPDHLYMHRQLQGDTQCPGEVFASKWSWFTDLVDKELHPAAGLPEGEPSNDPAILAQKIRWWLEEIQRQSQAGHADYANVLRLSLIKLTYRLEAALKAR